ncbi:Bug family tripartite tricarboxylate transporter substrate binding protein [Halomonas sp. C05BenzN]|uniref:Bug family tripartite tricarboxylate transporter substrate binding protein n=1 Tax=Halomonas sp. C05BenzN TaxID=3411041 RepID=UPI003B946078
MSCCLPRALLLVILLSAGQAWASDAYPERDIRLVIPFGPGGATDVLMRTIAREAQPLLGVAIETVNLPGAGATRGSQAVREAEPDGYTLLGSHQTLDLSFLAGVAPYSHEAFAPIALLTRTVNIPAARSGHVVQSADEVADRVQQRPGELRFGMIASSTDHFFWLQFFRETGIAPEQVRLVRYPDTGSQVAALLAGEIDFAMLNLPSGGELFRAGVLRPLGVAHERRLEALPEVPTLREQGIDLVNSTDRGLFAPLETPPEHLRRLAQAFEAALANRALTERIEREFGSLVSFRPLGAYADYLAERHAELAVLADEMPFAD